MERFRIHCKIHDSQDRVVQVGIGKDLWDKDKIWNWIDAGTYEFYTTEKGYEAKVLAKERDGHRYLTTAADKTTDNNLDELPKCT